MKSSHFLNAWAMNTRWDTTFVRNEDGTRVQSSPAMKDMKLEASVVSPDDANRGSTERCGDRAQRRSAHDTITRDHQERASKRARSDEAFLLIKPRTGDTLPVLPALTVTKSNNLKAVLSAVEKAFPSWPIPLKLLKKLKEEAQSFEFASVIGALLWIRTFLVEHIGAYLPSLKCDAEKVAMSTGVLLHAMSFLSKGDQLELEQERFLASCDWHDFPQERPSMRIVNEGETLRDDYPQEGSGLCTANKWESLRSVRWNSSLL